MNAGKVVSIQKQGQIGQAGVAPRQAAVAFRELMRLLGGGGAAQRDLSAAVVLSADAEALMRAVLARYGFERLPATYRELFALFEYCDCLDAASGIGMRPDSELAEWQAASFVVWRRKSPQLMPAIELHCAGEVDALRELHRREDTLAALGQAYLQSDD